MVPFLYFLLAHSDLFGIEVPSATQAVVAHATSLLVIVPVSIRGAWLYHRSALVDWNAVWRMGLASLLTAVGGARVAVLLPASLLKVMFGIFLLIVATRLVWGARPTESVADSHLSMPVALAGGAAVGFFSALLGVGGGLVAIPVLIYGLHLPIRKVSATSLAIITFTASAGVLTYIISGLWHEPGLGGALTYIQLPAAAALALGALIAVPLGARIQLGMPTHALRWLFAFVFLLLGARIAVVNVLTVLGRP